jgi:tetratricopeptide (TPR) repeat protein/DNA-directed RNA polymerase subunit RPC12/RpoP
MDVRCARCGIEYEFDDALISDRGTMVRCTECGHQFRVHPSHVIPGAPDEWRIVTPDGQTIVYLTLRELQQGITQGQVGRDANLIRGSSPARPLGTIAELDPFFPTPAGEQRQQSTLTGVAPPSLAPAAAPTPPKPTPTAGRSPIARIGLNTVQVSASGVGLEPPALANRPRKTTLGMGEDPQKIREIAARAREAAQASASPQPSADKTEVDAPVADNDAATAADEAASNGKLATPASKQQVDAKPLLPQRGEPAKTPGLKHEAPSAKENDTSPARENAAPQPAPAASAKAAIPKQRPKVPGASAPPTLRNTDAQDDSVPPKRLASLPPRPDPRITPTPGARLASVTQASVAERVAAADHAAALPLTVKSPSKPPTDPPPALRSARDETQFQQNSEPPAPTRAEVPARPEVTAGNDESPRSNEMLPPPVDAKPEPAEESMALVFQAESPPLEHSPADAATPAAGQATAAMSHEPAAGSFMPTVPPKRLLTNADSGLSSETRASGSRMGRWIMAALLIVLLSLVAFWFNSRSRAPSVSPVASSGTTIEQYLSNASDALYAGDLVRAHDQLQSSQTVGGRDPRWIALTARYDVMRADMNWLAVRLADQNDSAHLDALKRELADHVAQALRALASIERLSVKDVQLDAARIDAQRLRGEIDAARQAAQTLRQPSPTPELAYAFASIELLSATPNYDQVFEWLGRARAADSGLGRAPAMLVLACVMSQRLDCARAELARLKSAAKNHPLLPEIEAYVSRAAAPALPSASAGDASIEAAAMPVPDAGAVVPSAPAPDSTSDLAGDFRLRLRRGAESLSRNELTRSEQLFRSVLAERPSDTEALTGLGDVARRRNNTASAINYYQKVLATNGQYLPALSALADVKWRSGDRAGAAPLYRRIVDQVGESAGYGQTAAQRLRELSEGSAKPNTGEIDKATPAASSKSDATRRTGKQP